MNSRILPEAKFRVILDVIPIAIQTTMKKVKLFPESICAVLCLCFFPQFTSAETGGVDYRKVLIDIQKDLSKLGTEFPQLRDFSHAREFDPEKLSLSFSYHTHKAKHLGGWTAGVPNPDDDGVWFYIDFHDPSSTAQIHTQTDTISRCLGSKRVSFLILEGKNTKAVTGRINSILNKHGLVDCR